MIGWRGPIGAAAMAAALTLLSACASALAPMTVVSPETPPAACLTPVDPAGVPVAQVMTTRRADGHREANLHDRWCRGTGPPVIVATPRVASAAVDPAGANPALAIVSWNVHVGGGDIEEMVRRLRSGALTGGVPVTHFVLLLQEAFRASPLVPAQVPVGGRSARALGSSAPGAFRGDVIQAADTLGLSIFYVPSMRNGALATVAEDRGNAILSTETLSDLEAIELPFARQRRVAVAATVSGARVDGTAWSVKVASVHLESTVTARGLWVFASLTRQRQARGLLDALGPGSLIVGGDFNTWFGHADRTYLTMAGSMTDAAHADRRPTFGRIFRLDHLFARPPAEWTVVATRLDDRMGSDHYPLLARVRMTNGEARRE